ncbi:Protein N-acetyltransferase, RimJ/RimL family [Allopseudospirillum japonicum]|uniref:Protein N-acetyltransferase, RimJ/RimL family n=1 Tax=Allopseudospirillum japonicum TaxID=64971 RepID=A0A1H6U7R6_9GAMM|nr:GNAT family N-acetyltransferase [Allopseudospirillum japonicum]SEI86624.1 Protein N-acetyltransferase, RimJ/RimL family [Allopseudospirillum japonicum]
MQDFKSYLCLPKQEYSTKDFKLRVIQEEDIEDIRVWRNAQLDVLRQPAPISQDQQKTYFSNEVWPSMQEPYPKNILFTFFKKKKRIGYGGLVHIAWEHRRAEISFLLNDCLTKDKVLYRKYFSNYLNLIKEVAFLSLKINRLYTETYAFRKDHINVLENCGFELEGIMRNHILLNNKYCDSIIHGAIYEK